MKRTGMPGRRTPMLRTVPLAGGAIPGRAPLRPRSAARAALYVKRRALVAQLLADRPSCEAKIAGLCTGRTVDVHELLSRARGGSILDETGLLALCRACHDHVTTHPAWAEGHGLALCTGQLVRPVTSCRRVSCARDHRLDWGPPVG